MGTRLCMGISSISFLIPYSQLHGKVQEMGAEHQLRKSVHHKKWKKALGGVDREFCSVCSSTGAAQSRNTQHSTQQSSEGSSAAQLRPSGTAKCFSCSFGWLPYTLHLLPISQPNLYKRCSAQLLPFSRCCRTLGHTSNLFPVRHLAE